MSFLRTVPSQIVTGEVAGSATAAVFPTIPCQMVMFKAVDSNAGNVYIGTSDVTVVTAATNTTAGWVLAAGQESGWIPADNMDKLYRICDNAGDDVVYMAVQ